MAMEENKQQKSLIYLNQPVSSEEADWIGVSSYVDKVHDVIQLGAEMIAITSDYGGGKSSVIELLEAKEKNEKKAKSQFIKVNLWAHSELPPGSEEATLELHKSLLYQIVSQISPSKGSYLTKRLSRNYGLLGISTGKRLFSFLTFLALLIAIGTRAYDTLVACPIEWIVFAGYGFAISLGVFLLFKADILFSFKNSEGNRSVDENEIFDLYRTIVWEYGKFRLPCCRKHYIIVIEDLDRTDGKAVPRFLKELRKYCLPYNRKERANNICFIVNVKPEALLATLQDHSEPEMIFPKIFDFSIDLRTINIDNYDVILKGLIEEKRAAIQSIGLELPEGEEVLQLRGLQWIIRGKKLGIREIKERLNSSFLLYESLVQKFGNNKVEYEKCAVASYITSYFATDFYKLEDLSFQELLNGYLAGELNQIDDYKNILSQDVSEEFIAEIKLLIENKLIDNGYRTYFYQYPKGSKLYTVEENIVWASIIYREKPGKTFEQIVKRISETDSGVIYEALDKVKKLGLTFPRVVFSYEVLYIEALRHFPQEMFRSLEDDISYEEIEMADTVELYKTILSFDLQRQIYSKAVASSFCRIWEDVCSQTALLKLRLMLCENYSDEILWYKVLYIPNHPIITIQELELIDNIDFAIELVNANSKNMSYDHFMTIHDKVMESSLKDSSITTVEAFYGAMTDLFAEEDLVEPFLAYMDAKRKIIPELEQVIFSQSTEIAAYIDMYTKLINAVPAEQITAKTLQNMHTLKMYAGLTPAVRAQQYKHGLYVDYIYSMVTDEIKLLDLCDPAIHDTIESNCSEIFLDEEKIWKRLRVLALEKFQEKIKDYLFMFEAEYPYVTEEELILVNHVQVAIKLLNRSVAEAGDMKRTAAFFNRARRTNTETYEILQFIAGYESGLVYELFYSLDMKILPYKNIAKAKQSYIVELLTESLELNDPQEALRFMVHTGILLSSLEEILTEPLKTDEQIREDYVDLINRLDKPTEMTISNLITMGQIFRYSPAILDKLFERNAFTIYIASSTLRDKAFRVEEDRRDALWPSYIKILKSEEAYKQTKQAMSQNLDFLNLLIAKKDYVGLPGASRIFLAKVPQDMECIENIMTYENDVIEQYFSIIVGFQDKEAAEKFVNEITSNNELIKSQSIYDNTHPKLIDPTLKSRYTRLRNKALE